MTAPYKHGIILPRNANIAQLVEQQFRKLQVKGSNPFIGSIGV
jgi:CobQ-like glutamine amidotransferase family enzyme